MDYAEHAAEQIAALPESPYRRALAAVTEMAVDRQR
jgi:geranylgeranyl pyrophosphate synthase